MTQITHQDEFVRFLKILQVKLQEHQKACDKFLAQIQKPITEILYGYTDIKKEPEPESFFAFKH